MHILRQILLLCTLHAVVDLRKDEVMTFPRRIQRSTFESLTFSVDRLHTDTAKPFEAMLRARLVPITPRPYTPISDDMFTSETSLDLTEPHETASASSCYVCCAKGGKTSSGIFLANKRLIPTKHHPDRMIRGRREDGSADSPDS